MIGVCFIDAKTIPAFKIDDKSSSIRIRTQWLIDLVDGRPEPESEGDEAR